MCEVYSVQVKQAPVSHAGLCVKKKFHVDLNTILIRPITK